MTANRRDDEMTARTAIAIAAAVVLVCVAAPVAAQSGSARYRFTTLLDSRDGLVPTRCAAINGSGTVGVQVSVDDPLEPFSMLVTKRDASDQPVMIAHTRRVANYPTFCDNGFSSITSDPSINESDEVAFQGNLDRLSGAVQAECGVPPQTGGQRQGVFLGAGGPLTTIAHTKNPPGNDFISEFLVADTSVNTSGQVAMSVELRDPLFDQALVVGSKEGTFDERFRNSTSEFNAPSARMSMNDSAQIAFQDSGIVVSNPDGTIQRVVDSNAGQFAVFDPSLNNSGLVAFTGSFFQGGRPIRGVFTSSGGRVTTVADSKGAYASFQEPSLNDLGDVVFTADLDEIGENFVPIRGVFTGPHSIRDKVLQAGDIVNGVRVSSVHSCAEALNNLGEIVMTVHSQNPRTFETRTVIVKATPR